MRVIIKNFIKICSETLPLIEPIYEFGSMLIPGQEKLANLRPFFPGKNYHGADMRKGPGVDIILNLHNIKLPSKSVGTVLILETLEHVEFPRRAIREVHRILKHDGILIISSVMNFPLHNFPYDYWRFTPEAFRSLLKEFNILIVDYAGSKIFPHTIIGIGVKGLIPNNIIKNLTNKLKLWKEIFHTPKKITRPRKNNPALNFIPPILLRVYNKFFNKKF